MDRVFTKSAKPTQYNTYDVVLKDKDGKEIFNRKCEFPTTWSENARIITASKYFTDEENSLVQLIQRVVTTINGAGQQQGTIEDGLTFNDELTHLLENQYASFNSPVWFNIGASGRPQQASACFLLDVEDNLPSILDWIKTEAIVFKGGSGSGVNISKLRAEGEPINPRGTSGGPLSFMLGADAMAGVIKSGSVARRAAKMVIMDVNHPDILKFIECKKQAEDVLRKFQALGDDIDVNSEILSLIPYQNANNSVSVTDAFMEAVKCDDDWRLLNRNSKTPDTKTVPAKEIFRKIAQTAWECGDPGLFYHDTSNRWHTCKEAGPIITTNPCGEWQFLTWTPCNLASINLLKYLDDGIFNVEKFIHTVKVMITAMDILCEYSDYPIPKIKEEANKYRTLGLGYANLGALLMSLGVGYDSDEARSIAASITSLMTSVAYWQSGELAKKVAAFPEFEKNKKSMLAVLKQHTARHLGLEKKAKSTHLKNLDSILGNAGTYWCNGEKVFRNAQVTLLAPTGTISFMMDCDTTGIEPELSLIKHKKLVGGGSLKIVNNNVSSALKSLSYTKNEADEIKTYIEEHNTVENCPLMTGAGWAHIAVFDCAFPGGGIRSIAPMGHVDMVAAVQEFLSSGISKTINMPANSTVEDVENIYMTAWKKGLKAVSIYRDGSKVAQPVKSQEKAKLNNNGLRPALKIASREDVKDVYSEGLKIGMTLGKDLTKPTRKRLPDTRDSKTHKFDIAGHEGYLTVGLYPDGLPGEIFITMSKEGSTISGLIDAFATSVSLCLQYGVPLASLVEKFKLTRFEPMGFTTNDDIKQTSSVIDYIFRWLDQNFKKTPVKPISYTGNGYVPLNTHEMTATALPLPTGDTCINCGGIMFQSGTCKTCTNCGENTGCS